MIPVIVIVLLLQVSRVLDESFDQIFNLYNPLVYEVADVFDTYIYRSGIVDGNYGYSAAVGLFKNVGGLIVVLGVNAGRAALQRIRALVVPWAIVRGRESLGSRLFDVANVIFLLLLSITFIYPFWTTFLQAFAPANEVYRSGLHIWIDRWRLDSWAFVFGHEPVGLVYANTLFRVFFGTLLTLVVTFSGAYALSSATCRSARRSPRRT